jgi:predicted deacylase
MEVLQTAIPDPGRVNRAYRADFGGLFRSLVSVGDAVKKGDLLWRIQGLNGESLEEFQPPPGGIVGMLRTFASVQSGDLLPQLFWESGKQ